MDNWKKYNERAELLQQLTAYEAAQATQKISFFRPNPASEGQKQFFKDQLASVRLVLGDNRSGKSVCGIVEMTAHALGYRPWLQPEDPYYIVRLANGEPIPVPNVGRIIAQDFEQAIKQNIWEKIQEWCPRGWYTIRKSGRGVPTQVNWKNGTIWYLMSDNQDDMDFEGTRGHYFWGDEPFGYRKYVALRRGLVDFGGHCWLTLTPLSQPWIADIIQSRANDPDGKVKAYRFKIDENTRDVGGFLTKDAIAEFEADLREDEKAARLGGEWLHLTGRVYKEWEPKEPFWVTPYEIPDNWPRVCIIDPHPKKPVAVAWFAVNPDNQVIMYRELFSESLRTIKDVADKIKELEGWEQYDGKWHRTVGAEPVVMRLIDSSSKEQERTSGYTILSKFAAEDIHCLAAPKRNAQAGYDAIHEALKINFEWGEPGLVVFNTCPITKQNFQRFCWDDWKSSRDRDIKGERQEVRKYDDDFIDTIRYYFQSNLTYLLLKRELKKQSFDEDIADTDGFNMFGNNYQADKPPREFSWQTY
jgi:hypothetical protein